VSALAGTDCALNRKGGDPNPSSELRRGGPEMIVRMSQRITAPGTEQRMQIFCKCRAAFGKRQAKG